MPATRLDEESQGLLRRILRSLAYRQMVAANLRGHGLKFLVDPEGRLSLVDDMRHIVSVVNRTQELYTKLGGGDLRREAATRMDRIPYPSSRFELAAFLSLADPAERVAMESYVDSCCVELAEIAREDLAYERVATRRGRALFDEFAADPTQLPLVRQVLHRWSAIVFTSLGRPGSAGDRRAVELGLRDRGVAEIVRDYLGEVGPMLEAVGLGLDDLRAAGVEVPA
jgi:hypothetical protein